MLCGKHQDGCISKTVIMVLLDEVLKCEAQSVSAEDPPTHHNAAQTDRASPSLYLSIPHLFSYHRNGDAYHQDEKFDIGFLQWYKFFCLGRQGDKSSGIYPKPIENPMKKATVIIISLFFSSLVFSPFNALAALGLCETSDELQIIKTEPFGFIVKLEEQQIYQTAAADLHLHKSYRNFGGDNVDILQEYSGGNICLAFTYLVIRWRPDGTHWVSEKFGNCRGPEITIEGDKIILSFESYVGRHSGTEYPAETWIYENGLLAKAETSAAKPPVKKAVKKVPTKKKVLPEKTPVKKPVKEKTVDKKVVKKSAEKKDIPKKTPAPVKELSYAATRDKTSKWAFVGGSACCNCVVDSVGNLPDDFPATDIQSVTFYLLTSRSNSEFDKIKVGPTELKLILGDSQVNAMTQELPSETMDPVQHLWYVRFDFDPPVSVGPGLEWKLLDGDGTWKSAAVAHTSDKPSGGLPGRYITKGCSYARTENHWYSVKFSTHAAEPEPSPLSVSASASKTSGETPLAVDFTGAVTGGTPPYTYSWDFGDGTKASGQNTYHIYPTAGSYSVSLTVTDSENNTSSSSLTVTATTLPSQSYVYVEISVFDPGGKFLFNRPDAREGWDTEGNLPSEFNLDLEICDAGGAPISGGKRSIAFESNVGGSIAKVIPTVTIGPLSVPPHHYRLALWENDNKDPTFNKGDHLIWDYSGEHCDFSKMQVTIRGNSYYGVEECQGSRELSFHFNDHYAFRHKENDKLSIVNGVLSNAGPEYEKAYILIKIRR